MTTESTHQSSPTFVTLTCSGGISLGAYMGGVFYELVKEAVKDEPKIVIDIITGASAGAMSGAIAAHYLLGGSRDILLSGELEKELFHTAWVKKADIKFIEQLKPEELKAIEASFLGKPSQNLSVLSGEAIYKISEDIKNPQPPLPESTDECTKQCNKPLALLMTVTNLQGLLKEKAKTKVITNAETREFLFESDRKGGIEEIKWNKLVQSARMSGAFPVAFPPIQDSSSITSPNFEDLVDDYFQPDSNPRIVQPVGLRSIREANNRLKFLYSDGGILDNLPIRKGIDFETEVLAWQRQRQKGKTPKSEKEQFFQDFLNNKTQELTERKYVYVVPAPVENLNSSKRLTKERFSMLEVALSGLKLPKAEQDCIQISEINHRNKLAAYKKQLIEELKKECTGNVEQVKATIEQAIPYRNIELSLISPNIIKSAPLFGQLPQDLKNYINNSRAEDLLASDFLGAFGGFFNQNYREHDFLLGRLCGLAWLQLNCPSINVSLNHIPNLLDDIQTKFLKDDPQPSDLKLSQKIRISRMVVRALRIVAIEGKIAEKETNKIIVSFWKVFFGIFKVLAVVILRTIEGIITIFMKFLEVLSF
jgi:predicted acylesterase/phospholipase RssA